MPDNPDEEQSSEDISTGPDDETINDPLTATDVEAPRKPFGSGADSAE